MFIETKRLYTRKLQEKDANDLFELHSDIDVMKYISKNYPKDVSVMSDFIKRQTTYYKQHEGLGIFSAFEKKSNEFVGWCALFHLDNTDKIEVGQRICNRTCQSICNTWIYICRFR